MNSPLKSRASGILLHPTSLPGPFTHGDIGPAARRFIDFLNAAGQTWWQMLPIHPIGGCDSPYDSPSAFAGSDLLISLEDLCPLQLLKTEELRSLPRPSRPGHADFQTGKRQRKPLLLLAHSRFQESADEHLQLAYKEFLAKNDAWVWDFALFTALREKQEMRSWVDWLPALRRREPEALQVAHEENQEEIRFQVFCQFLFHYQWAQLKTYAHERQVQLMGDIPMFVSHDSSDVWANQEMFHLDEDGHRTVQAGVPPDYFSEDGQLWGNPLYRWEVMRTNGYGWWIDRLRRELDKFDAVRLDHFIAFSRYWEVPMNVTTAKDGRYVDVPGHDFLEKARDALGGLPFVAEDLGTLTPQVEQLRDRFALPGMKILQFAFAHGAESYLPHQHPPTSVAYLGTHDNNTTRGWYESLLALASEDAGDAASAQEQLTRLRGYTGVTRTSDVCTQMIRALMCSPATTAMLTIQDLLDQGSEYRMNIPGVADGNWNYRLPAGSLTRDIAEALKAIVEATERSPQR